MEFKELVDIVARLRAPGGCPWDREQTRETLKPFLIEELYELVDAIDQKDLDGMKEELGDLLLQIVLQSRLAEEEGAFDMKDVIEGISQKMVRRHPHVFGDMELETSDDVNVWWEESKKNEGKSYESVLGGVPLALPALIRASEIQKKATEVGFDWDKITAVFKKLDEEIGEFRSALDSGDQEEIADELGDIFFVLVRIANFVNTNPEDALKRTITKFEQRFRHMELEASRQSRTLSDMSLDEMEALWREAKIKR